MMRFPVHYNEKEVMVDVTCWESNIDNRIEYYAVFADQQETFVNFVKRTDQSTITEVSSSADLTDEIKSIIRSELTGYIRHTRE